MRATHAGRLGGREAHVGRLKGRPACVGRLRGRPAHVGRLRDRATHVLSRVSDVRNTSCIFFSTSTDMSHCEQDT